MGGKNRLDHPESCRAEPFDRLVHPRSLHKIASGPR